MPRQQKTAEQPLPQQTLVVDNGAYAIKAGFVSESPKLDDCRVIPNCVARDRGKKVWIGEQLERCTDFGEIVFRRPVEKGYLVNWEAEKMIWENSFFDQGAKLKVSSTVRLSAVADLIVVRSARDKSCTYRSSKYACSASKQL